MFMEILLNSNFYSQKSVEKTIAAFEEEGVASFDYSKEKNTHKIVLSGIDPLFKNHIKEEFCNYVLFEEKNI